MTEPDNDTRAEWARQTLQFFCTLTRCDPDTAASDLICNTGHLIDRDKEYGDDLKQVVDHGMRMYEDEKTEEDTPA